MQKNQQCTEKKRGRGNTVNNVGHWGRKSTFSFYPQIVYLAGLVIEMTKGRLTSENHILIHAHRNSYKYEDSKDRGRMRYIYHSGRGSRGLGLQREVQQFTRRLLGHPKTMEHREDFYQMGFARFLPITHQFILNRICL